MKPLLLLLPLALLAAAPAPPAVRVTFSPLTRAAYRQAKAGCHAAPLQPTFPVRKQQGQLVIPTAQGNRVFRDSKLPEEDPDWEAYEYKGYLPQAECHLVFYQHYEWARMILVFRSGQQLTLQDSPVFAPDWRSFVDPGGGLEYWANENDVRLYQLRNHRWRRVWHTVPTSWEPRDLCWASDTTLLLQRRWLPGERRTYARLLVRPAVPGNK